MSITSPCARIVHAAHRSWRIEANAGHAKGNGSSPNRREIMPQGPWDPAWVGAIQTTPTSTRGIVGIATRRQAT